MRYRVAPRDRAVFLRAMAEVQHVRGRAGALDWRLYEDVAHPEGWLEVWCMQNWTDHLREAVRLSEEDKQACWPPSARSTVAERPLALPASSPSIRASPLRAQRQGASYVGAAIPSNRSVRMPDSPDRHCATRPRARTCTRPTTT